MEQDQKISGLTPEEQEKFKSAIERHTGPADAGDAMAAYYLGEWYYRACSDNPEEYGELAHKYLSQAAEADIATAYYLLSDLAANGVGQRAQAADAVHYLERYIELFDENDKLCRPNELTIAYEALGMTKASGEGTQRDIPLSRYYVNTAMERGEVSEDTQNLHQWLEETYPFNTEGEIDIDVHGRTKFTTFLIVLGVLGCIWGFCMPSLTKGAGDMLKVPFYIGMAVNLAAYGGVLMWQRWSGWLMLVQWVLSPVFAYFAMIGIAHHSETAWTQFCMSQFVNPMLSTFILAMLQKRKAGYALPWCSVSGMRDDGRNMLARIKDFFMAYGEGDAYRANSAESKTFVYVCYAATAVIAIASLYVAYLYITSDKQWGADIEWVVWKSPNLWFFLSVIGFFAQFFDWQHFSYKTITIFYDENGKEKKRERNRDMLTEMEGGILFPLLMHLLVMPAMYGALFYYAIMIVIAVAGALIPYVLAVLLLAASYPFYRIAQHFFARRWRVVLLAVFMLFCLMILYALAKASGSDMMLNNSGYQNDDTVGEVVSANDENSFVEEIDCDVDDIDEEVAEEPESVIYVDERSSCTDTNHPHMIDLGLPSGTMWACCNLHASDIDQEGDLIDYEQVDGDSNIPTEEQANELAKKCEITKTDNGFVVTGPNGNKIFFPNNRIWLPESFGDDWGYNDMKWPTCWTRSGESPWFEVYTPGEIIDGTAGNGCKYAVRYVGR
jgi:hypothetical protein